MEVIKLGKNGQIAIPRAAMKRLNLKGDETLLLEVADDGDIRGQLRPAAVLPIGPGGSVEQFEAAGYIAVDKDFAGKKPRTRASITRLDRREFEAHVQYLRDVIAGALGAMGTSP